MDISDTPQTAVTPGPVQSRPQPIGVLADLEPMLDDNAVREATIRAEAQGIDPQSLKLSDLAQAPAPKVEVPQKFLKPDGVVDVEKIQASTRQLDEAIQRKEAALNKTIEEVMGDYRTSETKFRNMPNAEKLAASLPQAPVAPSPAEMSTQQLEEMIRRDYQQDPVMTTTRLIELSIQKALEPVRAKEQDEFIRKNVAELAEKDPRFLEAQNYELVKAKLRQDPDLWKLKNPHKAAWLEVKEELRLGENLSGNSAQPSRVQTPVLGGGTPPPSTPSSSVSSPQNVIGSLDKLDLRDRRQEAMGDEAIKALLAGRR